MKALDFDEHFLTVPIVYDNIFQEIRSRANQDFAGFRAAILGLLRPLMAEAV